MSIQKEIKFNKGRAYLDRRRPAQHYIFSLYLFRLNQRVSQRALRGQLIGYYNSLRGLLDDFPVIRDKYFIIGLSQGKKEEQDLKKNLATDPRFVLCLQACSWRPDLVS